eukprot:scaffold290057_cov33-Tisochrysis_lutea.AAC.2
MPCGAHRAHPGAPVVKDADLVAKRQVIDLPLPGVVRGGGAHDHDNLALKTEVRWHVTDEVRRAGV